MGAAAYGVVAGRAGLGENAGPAETGDKRSTAVRSDRHSAGSRLPRTGDRVTISRAVAARSAPWRVAHDVRAHLRAGDEPRGAFQAGTRERTGLGHHAGQRPGGAER